MKYLLIIVSAVNFLLSCNAQEKKIKIIITNKSSLPIDSIIFPNNKNLAVLSKVAIADFIAINVNIENIEANQEGAFPLYIYQNKKAKYAQWGLHDFGVFARLTDSIFFHDYGITYTDKQIEKPTIFSIYLIKKADFPIDSVQLGIPEIRRIKLSNETIEIQALYQDVEKNPFILVRSANKTIKINITHDWSDWNSNQSILYCYDNYQIKYSPDNAK